MISAATHLIPQTFDTRPSPPPTDTPLGGYPDELMIDWRNTPVGASANIYWPAVSSADVIVLASKLYPSSSLVALDAHTIQCKVAPGMTYVPIPPNGSESFAGLITVRLPASIHVGDEFNIVIRRVTSRRLEERGDGDSADAKVEAVGNETLNWRYVVGTFQMTIPVGHDEAILAADENQLAILTWRLEQLTPKDRWHPVLRRYIGVVSQRVRGLGGDPNKIEPSPLGFHPLPSRGKPIVTRGHELTGKIAGLRYDRFGDFKGFDLVTLQAEEHRFRGHERRVEDIIREAWVERTLVTVIVTPEDPHWPLEIILRRA